MPTNIILTAADIYWVLMLPGIFHALAWFGFFLIVAAIVLMFYNSCIDCRERNDYFSGKGGDTCIACKKKTLWARGLIYIFVPLGLIFIVGNAFIPSRNQLIAMYVIPPVVNNVGVQKMPENLVNLINKEMESLIAGIDKKEEEKKDKKDAKDTKDTKKEEKAVLSEDMKKIAIDAATQAATKALESAKN